jgi:hypothetical protein
VTSQRGFSFVLLSKTETRQKCTIYHYILILFHSLYEKDPQVSLRKKGLKMLFFSFVIIISKTWSRWLVVGGGGGVL